MNERRVKRKLTSSGFDFQEDAGYICAISAVWYAEMMNCLYFTAFVNGHFISRLNRTNDI